MRYLLSACFGLLIIHSFALSAAAGDFSALEAPVPQIDAYEGLRDVEVCIQYSKVPECCGMEYGWDVPEYCTAEPDDETSVDQAIDKILETWQLQAGSQQR